MLVVVVVPTVDTELDDCCSVVDMGTASAADVSNATRTQKKAHRAAGWIGGGGIV